MKRVFTVLLALLMLATCFSLLACQPGDNPDGKSGTIKIWWPGGSPTTEAAIKKAKELYEQEHEGVTIDIVMQSTADFYSSYTMALMGKEYPDIAYVDHVFVQRLAFDGLIANLSELGLDSEKDKFISSLWNTTQYDGATYALPMSANVLVTVYNKALLTKVTGRAFGESDLPKNWEEFLALGKSITDYNLANNLTDNDQLYLTTIPAGTGAESMGAMIFMSYCAREGGTLMNADLTQMTIASDANKSAAAKIQQLGSLNYTPKNYSESKFETGKVAFIEMGSWKLIDYSRIAASNENCDYGYTTAIPMTTGGNTQSALGLYSLVLTKKSKNQELAADFIKFLTTNDEIQLMHNTVQNLMPTTKSALEDDFYKTDEWAVFIEQLKNVVARPGSAAWPAIQRTLAEYVTDLVANNKNGTPDYLDAIEIQLDETLEDLENE